MASEQKLIEEMRRALHGVETFLRQILCDEQLSAQAQARGQSLRNVVNKVLEKTSSFGKPTPLSPSPSGLDLHGAPPDLPTKPTATLPPALESIDVEVEQENYEAMDPIERPRIDTAGSLYAPMASIAMNEPEAISEETYEAMVSSPGHSGSGQFAQSAKEDIANITEELYLEMDATMTAAPAQKPPPANLPPKPRSESAMSPGSIQQLGVTHAEPGFEGEEYTAMSGVGQEEADDFYEAPTAVPPRTSPPGTEQGATKGRAQTLPHQASSQGSFDGTEEDDPYDYHVPLSSQKTSAEALANSTQKGFLDKLGGRGGKTWQKRFVILADGAMYYFESDKDKKPRNVVPIAGYRVEEDPEHSKGKKYAFKVTPLSADKAKSSTKSVAKGKGGKSYHFRANSFEERKQWVSALRAALVRANRRSQTFLDAAVDEPSGGSGSGSVTSASSHPIAEEGGEDFYEDPTAPQTKATSLASEFGQDDYLAPNEVKSPVSPASPVDTYLPPVEVTKPRASSTFGIGKEVETANLGESNPYATRKDANPYASRQQMRLPTPPAGENPYQSRKQTQPLPKAPDFNPYASRQQLKLPPVPDKTPAPVAPIAPRPPSNTPTSVNTQAIYVQLPDAKFKYEQVFVAMWDYQPSASDELGFKRGELLYIENVLESAEWWVGRKKSNYDEDTFSGDRGLLVSTYVSPAYEKLI